MKEVWRGRQSRRRKALRTSGMAGGALWMSRVTSATNVEVRQHLGHHCAAITFAHATNGRPQWFHGWWWAVRKVGGKEGERKVKFLQGSPGMQDTTLRCDR